MIRIVVVAAIVLTVALCSVSAHAADDCEMSFFVPVCENTTIDEFGNPPEHAEDRCSSQTFAEGEPVYNVLDPEPSDYFKFGEGQVLIEDLDGAAVEILTDDVDNQSTSAIGKVIRTHRWFDSWCVDATGAKQPGSHRAAWIRIVDEPNLIQALFVEVRGQLTSAELSWPTVSPTHDWQMVKVPLEIRGQSPEPIHASKSASNHTGTLTVTIDATPKYVLFDPGVTSKAGTAKPQPVACPSEWLAAPVPKPESPSPCSYSYTTSSVVTGRAFTTTTATIWEIATGDPDFNGLYPGPSLTRDLLVAEAQALVTDMG